MKYIYFNKGSALLIALMIMSSLGVATLSAAKLFLSESKISINISETAGAYYAAEGALEKALLDYKFKPRIQLSANCDNRISDQSGCVATKDDGWYSGRRLNDQTKTFTKIYSFSDTVSDTAGINKDETREFSVAGSANATLNWEWEGGVSDQIGVGMRVIYIDVNTGAVDSGKSVDDIFKPQNQLTIPPNTIVRVRPMGENVSSYTLSTSPGGRIDAGETVIDAKSEYRDISRQLQMTINKNQNQGMLLNGLFDYTLLSDCSLDNDNCTP